MSASSGSSRRAVLGMLAVGLLAVVAMLAFVIGGASRSTEILVEVEAGTGDRIAAGEEIELLPRILNVEVGDELVIVNHDDQVHEVGPYTVAAGQTLRQRFTSPGTLEGVCTLHPSGEISIVVS